MTATVLNCVTRSDAALRQTVVNALTSPEFPGTRGVIVEVTAGVVTLRGSVKSFYARQLLVHACRRIPRVTGIIDELHVTRTRRARGLQLAE